MPQPDYTTTLLDLEYAEIDLISQNPDSVVIEFHLKRRVHHCPHCDTLTDIVHDYRTQFVKDIPVLGRPLVWKYRKRRYHCPCCGKHFFETNHLLPKWHRITSRLAVFALSLLREKRSVKDIALSLNISSSSLFRWLQYVHFPAPDGLPRTLSIDEFKGNADHRKFQCIITDPVHKRVIDILPDRSQTTLLNYFRSFPKEKRKNVKYFVSDMNRVYVNIAERIFPDATIVIDKFHVARFCSWAVENVRRNMQKDLPQYRRKYMKRSRKLLLMPMEDLNDEQREQVINMLQLSTKLENAYLLKEYFHEFMKSENAAEAKERLHNFRILAATVQIEEFETCLKMLENREPYILNAFDTKLSNGFTEGTNNMIKVIKRIAFGYRSFEHLRKRIFLITNHLKKSPGVSSG